MTQGERNVKNELRPGWLVKLRFHPAPQQEFEILWVGRKYLHVLDLSYYKQLANNTDILGWTFRYPFRDVKSYQQRVRGSAQEFPWVTIDWSVKENG